MTQLRVPGDLINWRNAKIGECEKWFRWEKGRQVG